MATTRERRERYIETFDRRVIKAAIEDLLSVEGLSIFPDWAIDQIRADLTKDWLSARRRNRQNRAIDAARRAREAQPSPAPKRLEARV